MHTWELTLLKSCFSFLFSSHSLLNITVSLIQLTWYSGRRVLPLFGELSYHSDPDWWACPLTVILKLTPLQEGLHPWWSIVHYLWRCTGDWLSIPVGPLLYYLYTVVWYVWAYTAAHEGGGARSKGSYISWWGACVRPGSQYDARACVVLHRLHVDAYRNTRIDTKTRIRSSALPSWIISSFASLMQHKTLAS